MKINLPFLPCFLSLILTISNESCVGQISPYELSPKTTTALDQNERIAEYVVELFEDSKGNLWFGTMSKGVARYDGNSLTYFSTENGLSGNTVASITEDTHGNLWFGTHTGLSKYDGISFTNFNTGDGLCHSRVSEVLIDRKGKVWVGTWGGVCTLNGNTFEDFPLPTNHVVVSSKQSSADWVTQILEDKDGNLWFSRDGYGVCKYNGESFECFKQSDGLASNNVQTMLQDKTGNIWFGSRMPEDYSPDPGKNEGIGGLNKFDGKRFTPFSAPTALNGNDIYALYEGKQGDIWIGVRKVGVYRYDGKNFILYNETDRADLMPYGYGVQGFLEDKKGTLWIGLSGGLFLLDGSTIRHVGQKDPWP